VEGIEGNLLLMHLAGGGRVAVRPSGTEPKAKFYVTVRQPVPEGIGDASLYELKQQTDAEASALMDAMHSLARGIAGVE